MRLELHQRQQLSPVPSIFLTQSVLHDFCQSLHSVLGYEYAAVQLVRFEDRVIETAYGTGAAATWAGISKHYLDGDPPLRDIQADVFQSLTTEIIRGWDDRFNRWIYDAYAHDRIVRAFTPIVLFRNPEGLLIDDWFTRCEWEVEGDTSSRAESTASAQRPPDQHTRIRMRLPGDAGRFEPLGTVEVGYRHLREHISVDEAIELVKLVGKLAPRLREVLLPYVLESIVDETCRILKADSASLHFLYDPVRQRYVYESGKGGVARSCLHVHPPRPNGLGQRAIGAGRVMFVPDADQDDLALRDFNPNVFETGIRTMAAAPLILGEESGVLYVGFEQTHRFDAEDIREMETLASRAIESIRNARIYAATVEKAKLLESLNRITQSMVADPNAQDILRQIAWTILNVLAADVVVIYEYYQAEGVFATPPVCAGRLRFPDQMKSRLRKRDIPNLVVGKGAPIYEPDILATPLAPQRSRRSRTDGFVIREGIRSACAVPLKVAGETFGLLFVNYRRPCQFTADLQETLNTLSSSAAIAIKNRRLLETPRYIERQLITTSDLKRLLGVIVARAAGVTAGEIAEIRIIESPSSEELVVGARYPDDLRVQINQSPETDGSKSSRVRWANMAAWSRILNGRSTIIADISADPKYNSPLGNFRSQLHVRLIAEGDRNVGILSVGIRRPNAFGMHHLRMVEALADQAVIAIQYARNQQRALAVESLAALGDLANPLMHWAKDGLSGIAHLADEIARVGTLREAKQRAKEVQASAQRIRAEADNLQAWQLREPQRVNVWEAMRDARLGAVIPPHIKYKDTLPDDLPRVWAGLKQLTFIFVNLLQNAVKAISDTGCITVSGRSFGIAEHRWVEVSVADTGCGIGRQKAKQIFERNYPRDPRTGIGFAFGLYWTRAYVEWLGGRVAVTSRLGMGSKFTVTLPVADSAHREWKLPSFASSDDLERINPETASRPASRHDANE